MFATFVRKEVFLLELLLLLEGKQGVLKLLLPTVKRVETWAGA